MCRAIDIHDGDKVDATALNVRAACAERDEGRSALEARVTGVQEIMGTWSHEPFGNDDANDWAAELVGSKGLRLVEDALDKVLAAGNDYVDASDAEEAIAAVEVLAKLLGKGTQSDAYTDKVDAWVARKPGTPSPELLKDAQHVLERIAGNASELAELWVESGKADAWRATLAKLQLAIGG